jgi:hypothetical protein
LVDWRKFVWLFGEILFGCLAIDFLTKRELRLQVIRYRSRIDALPDPGDLGEDASGERKKAATSFGPPFYYFAGYVDAATSFAQN